MNSFNIRIRDKMAEPPPQPHDEFLIVQRNYNRKFKKEIQSTTDSFKLGTIVSESILSG